MIGLCSLLPADRNACLRCGDTHGDGNRTIGAAARAPSRRREVPVPASLERVVMACLEKKRNIGPNQRPNWQVSWIACTDIRPWTTADANRLWNLHGHEAAQVRRDELPSRLHSSKHRFGWRWHLRPDDGPASCAEGRRETEYSFFSSSSSALPTMVAVAAIAAWSSAFCAHGPWSDSVRFGYGHVPGTQRRSSRRGSGSSSGY